MFFDVRIQSDHALDHDPVKSKHPFVTPAEAGAQGKWQVARPGFPLSRE